MKPLMEALCPNCHAKKTQEKGVKLIDQLCEGIEVNRFCR